MLMAYAIAFAATRTSTTPVDVSAISGAIECWPEGAAGMPTSAASPASFRWGTGRIMVGR
jgi:hypothetical protein